MSEFEQEEFHKKLNALAERIRMRKEEFQKTGEFSDTHRALANQIERRHGELRQRVAEEQRKGTAWDLIKAELTRDYSAIYDDLLTLEERLDKATMRQPGERK